MKIFKEEKNAETSVFEKLDFDYVLHAIEKHCYIRDNPIEDFSSNPSAVELINQELNYVKELMKSLDNNLVVYYDGLVDFREVVKKIKKESLEYEFEEFVQIYNGVKLCRLLVNWYNKSEKKFEYPQMHELLNNFDLSKFDFTKAIEKVIDFKKLEVKSDASDLLASLRRKKLETERTYQKRFSTLLKQYIKQGILAESPESVHDGKRVLAVNATYKNQVNGIIVGASQSGNIVFMHDNTLMPILYEFSMIDVEEKVEIKRILKELAFLLLKSDDAIEQMSKFTRQLDRWQAKAKFGIKYECTFPKSLQADKIEIKGGRHPKLIDKIKQSEKIVPINFDLSKDQRIMVISGPNAGGKSVALKTFGTLLLMVNHAIPLSVDEGAQLHIFSKVFVDIGDDQSIQDDLSTYSSHLSKMAALLRQKPMETFFLIDEFGKGTDPALGGPIASSILQTLNERKFWGIVTTHYSDLKELAQQEKGLVNAAMTFNKIKLKPTYELVKGLPGSSFAFEIASKVGFSEEVLNRIIKKVGTSKSKLEQNLGEIQTEKQFLKNLRKEVQKKNDHLDRLISTYEKLKKELEKKQKSLEKTYDQKLLEAYNKANRELENLIRKSSTQEKEELKKKRISIDKKRKSLSDLLMKKDEEKTLEILNDKIEVGDSVILEGNDQIGMVKEFRKKNVIVEFGKLTYNVTLNKLQKVRNYTEKRVDQKEYTNRGSKELEEQSEFNCVLDLRGLYKGEALKLTEQFLDRAILFNIEKLHIVHGRGRGTIRELVQNYLKSYPHVKKYGKADRENGGDGVTEVYL